MSEVQVLWFSSGTFERASNRQVSERSPFSSEDCAFCCFHHANKSYSSALYKMAFHFLPDGFPGVF